MFACKSYDPHFVECINYDFDDALFENNTISIESDMQQNKRKMEGEEYSNTNKRAFPPNVIFQKEKNIIIQKENIDKIITLNTSIEKFLENLKDPKCPWVRRIKLHIIAIVFTIRKLPNNKHMIIVRFPMFDHGNQTYLGTFTKLFTSEIMSSLLSEISELYFLFKKRFLEFLPTQQFDCGKITVLIDKTRPEPTSIIYQDETIYQEEIMVHW
jgi:hypothetical protein